MDVLNRRFAGMLALLTALIHTAELNPTFKEGSMWLGTLFIVGIAATAYAGVRLFQRDDAIAWLIGGLTVAGMITGYFLSRTIGFPGMPHEWEVLGNASIAIEALYLGGMLLQPMLSSRTEDTDDRVRRERTHAGTRTTGELPAHG